MIASIPGLNADLRTGHNTIELFTGKRVSGFAWRRLPERLTPGVTKLGLLVDTRTVKLGPIIVFTTRGFR